SDEFTCLFTDQACAWSIGIVSSLLPFSVQKDRRSIAEAESRHQQSFSIDSRSNYLRLVNVNVESDSQNWMEFYSIRSHASLSVQKIKHPHACYLYGNIGSLENSCRGEMGVEHTPDSRYVGAKRTCRADAARAWYLGDECAARIVTQHQV